MDGLMHEILIQKAYLADQTIKTIYFGGGTPSILEVAEIERLIEHIQKHFKVLPDAEITLEANPDDLNTAKVSALKNSPVNRFSIGVQSFFEEDLRWMNRSHQAKEAEAAIKRVQDAGFENITADLIYGYPLLSDEKWFANIQMMVDFGVSHLSCYAMTVEEGTALHHFIKQGKQNLMNDSQAARQFVQLMERLEQAGFIHYEISNFARPEKESKHNSNYWKGHTYLGIGPSAHSFNGTERQWNVANNNTYLHAIQQGEIPASRETLSVNNRFNEYLMTSLRTIWGVDSAKIKLDFGEHYWANTQQKIVALIDKNWIETKADKIFLTREGKLFADHIASELFIVDDE